MAGVVFGLALSVASTVVLLRALESRNLVETERGRIAIGWLIVEDIFTVLALVLLPAVAGAASGDGGSPAISFGTTLVKLVAFVALMAVVGRRVIPWALHWVVHTGSRELFRLPSSPSRWVWPSALATSSVFLCSRCILRRDDPWRNATKPESHRGNPAAARRFCGPLLRFGRYAFRPCGGSQAADCAACDAGNHHLRQIACRLCHRSNFRPRQSDCSRSLRQPRANWRIFFHSCELGNGAGSVAGRRTGPHPGGRDHFHPASPLCVQLRGEASASSRRHESRCRCGKSPRTPCYRRGLRTVGKPSQRG